MSSVSTDLKFRSCPYSVLLEREGAPIEPSFAAQSGVIKHKFLQDYGQHLLKTKQEDDWDYFDKSLADLEKSLDPDMFEDVKLGVRKAKEFITVKSHGQTYFELEFCFDDKLNLIPWTDDRSKYYFRGRIDNVEFITKTEAKVVDFKTGWGRNADPNQLRWYAAVMMYMFPKLDLVRTAWFYTLASGKRRVEIIDGPSISRDELMGVIKTLKERMDLIHKSVLTKRCPANLGTACATCSVTRSCKYYQEYTRKAPEGDFAQDRQRLYNAYIIFKTEYQKLGSILKKMADTEGHVKVGEKLQFKDIGTVKPSLQRGVALHKFLVAVMDKSGASLDKVIDQMDISVPSIRQLLALVPEDKLSDLKREFIVDKHGKKYELIEEGSDIDIPDPGDE